MAAFEHDTDSKPATGATAAASGGWRSLLGNRLLLALLAVSLIPLAILAVATYRSAAAALTDEAFAKLETVRTITAKSVERYFQTLHDELRVLAEDRMTIAACQELQKSFATVVSDNAVDAKELARVRREVEAHYVGEFAAEFRKRAGEDLNARPLVDALRRHGIIHDDPREAARFVRGLAGDARAWWSQADLQADRRRFVATYANFSDDWLERWRDELTRLSL